MQSNLGLFWGEGMQSGMFRYIFSYIKRPFGRGPRFCGGCGFSSFLCPCDRIWQLMGKSF